MFVNICFSFLFQIQGLNSIEHSRLDPGLPSGKIKGMDNKVCACKQKVEGVYISALNEELRIKRHLDSKS